MKTLEQRLIWLAGLWDGEGCFGIYASKFSTRNRTVQYPVVSAVVNTNPVIMQDVMSILDALGVVFSCHWQRRDNPRHKPWARISIGGQTQNVRFLPYIIPYLIGKRAQAELLLRFSQRRISVRHANPTRLTQKPGGGILRVTRTDGYSPEDVAACAEMHRLNQRGLVPKEE